MKLRNKGNRTVEINDQLISAPHDNEDIWEIKEKDRTLDKMSRALKELNKEQELCVTLFYLERKSYQQVADQTGYSLMQVKSHIQNGKRNLKLHLERLQQNER